MNGLDPERQRMLMQLGLNLMAQSGPSRFPRSTFDRIGQAGLQTMQGMDQYRQLALVQQLRNAQMKQMEARTKALGEQEERRAKTDKIRSDMAGAAKEAVGMQGIGQKYGPMGISPQGQQAAMLAEQGTDLGEGLSPQQALGSNLLQGGLQLGNNPLASAGMEMAFPQTQEQGPMFGKSLEGISYDYLMKAQQYKQAGLPVPPDLQMQAETAKHHLTQPRVIVGPLGGRHEYTPGLPPFAKERKSTTSATGKLTPLLEGREQEFDKQLGNAMTTIGEVADLLNEAKESGETITGWQGWLKSKGGGIARQAGIPISPQAERLNKALLRLQGVVGPLILNEKRLSETERQRLNEIVGAVNASQDEVSIRESMRDLVIFLQRIKK